MTVVKMMGTAFIILGIMLAFLMVYQWLNPQANVPGPSELRIEMPAGWDCLETGNTVVCHPRKGDR